MREEERPSCRCCCCLADLCPDGPGCRTICRNCCADLLNCRFVCCGSALSAAWSADAANRGRWMGVCCCSTVELVNPTHRVPGKMFASNQCEGCVCACCGSEVRRADYCTAACCGATADRSDCSYACCATSVEGLWDGACCCRRHVKSRGCLWPCLSCG